MLGSGAEVEDDSPMARQIRENTDIQIKVDDVVYMPSLDAPPEKPHSFVYFISIFNNSSEPVTIRGRKWVLRQDDGEVTVVEGEGVVGQTPQIEPGGHFSYNSYHVIGINTTVSGAFFGEGSNGEWIFARIPDFRLDVPKWA
jgi:ApaG protein